MITISEIAKCVDAISVFGNKNHRVDSIKSLDDTQFSNHDLAWCSDKNSQILKTIDSGTVILSNLAFEDIVPKKNVHYIVVTAPRKAFQKVLQTFFVEKTKWGIVAPSAIIDESVIYNSDFVNIGPNVVLEKGCVLGQNVVIQANTVVRSETKIHDNVTIGCNCTIGGVGFGYETNEEGEFELIPHIGNVVLNNGVEIGNNVCIDRAVLGSTFLDENVKVDNLVHIAHGVKIGKNSLIIANAMIAGSVAIGENVWVSPSSSIRQKLSVEDNSLVGLGAVVVKNVEKGEIVAGNPAKPFPKK